MLKTLFVLCVLFGLSLNKDLFSYKDCGGSKLKFVNISVSPLPITLNKTEKLTVSAKAEIVEDLPVDALAELKLIKLLDINGQILELEIPCVDDMGSCTLQVCDLFSKWYNDVICPFMKKSNIECKCPIHKAVLAGDNIEVEVPFAKIKGIIAQLASGDYNIEFRITDPSKKENYSCLKLHANIVVN